jgi:hypothetical protein
MRFAVQAIATDAPTGAAQDRSQPETQYKIGARSPDRWIHRQPLPPRGLGPRT